jgi:hypothetical protein
MPWTGLIDTVLVAAAAVVLTIAGHAVVERSDVLLIQSSHRVAVSLSRTGSSEHAMRRRSHSTDEQIFGRIGGGRTNGRFA